MRIGRGIEAGDQPDAGGFHIAFAAGHLSGEAQPRLDAQPKLLDPLLRLKAMPRLRFAGQITGCEGYVESAAIGLLAGRFAAAERLGEQPRLPPPTTAHGALLGHITGGHVETIEAGARSFQPMNINLGLFPPLGGGTARGDRKRALCTRALADLDDWIAAVLPHAAQ